MFRQHHRAGYRGCLFTRFPNFPQSRQHRTTVSRPVVRSLREHCRHQLLDGRRDCRTVVAIERRWWRFENCVEQCPFGRAAKWATTGEHLVQNDAQRPYIRAGIGLSTAQQLWRHVGQRARNRRTAPAGNGVITSETYRHSKIKNLCNGVICKSDVGRLEIAVDDVGAMRAGQPTRQLCCDGDGIGYRKQSRANAITQCAARTVVHHKTQPTVTCFFNGVDRAHVWIVEGRSRLRFPDQSPSRGGIGELLRR